MPALFSFIGNEFESLFQHSDLFLPGIEKLAGIYYHPGSRELKIISRWRNGADPYSNDFVQKRENLVILQKYRSDEKPYSWINKSDLPFEIPDKEHRLSPDLFSELDNVILLLRMPNAFDHLSDLLLIYFNRNLGTFGLSKSDKVLSTENKTIIGYLLYHQFKSIMQINSGNKEVLSTLNTVVNSVVTENIGLREYLKQLQATHTDNIIGMANQHLASLSRSTGRNYILNEESIQKLKEYKGNLRHIGSILKTAVIFTENLSPANLEDPVVIHPFSISFDSYQVDDKPEYAARKIDSRMSKAMLLLDKLENAAKVLRSNNLPLIGTRMGQALDPPVTAPAITDALGKNANLIRQLLMKYPEKWEIIRKDFKPLHNQLRKIETGLSETGTD
ncbi:MAG: hypothetical protein KA096_02750 [Bacteroidales bacterium]|nr:hypothetical protein [Bacteroidales bacterium]